MRLIAYWYQDSTHNYSTPPHPHLHPTLPSGVDGDADMSERADRLTGKASLTSGLILGRSEVLRSLRHYLRAQSQGHHTIDRLEERAVERGSAR